MSAKASPTRPNILLVMTDEHAAHVAGYAGDRIIRTPNLDRLEGESSRFEQAYCSSPACTPSRMSLLTAKEPHHCAAWGNHWIIFPEHETWPRHFAAHGYATCLVGKMHFGGKDQMQGFQYRPYGDFRHGLGHQAEPLSLFPGYNAQESAAVCEIPESLNHDVVVIRETLAFVLEHRAAQPEKPWFACASFTRPHSPFTAPARFFRRYQGKVFAEPLPKNPEAEYDPYTLKLARKSWQIESTQEMNDRGLQGYYAALDFVDDCIGELLRGLERSGALDNTIVIYTSDHGEVCGRHGYFGKAIHFEESIRVPLLIRLPQGRRRRRLFNRPVSLMDLFPTACGLVGLPVPKGVDGIDLSARIQSGRQSSWPRATVSSMYCQWGARINYTAAAQDTTPHAAFRTLRWRDWKYVAIQGAAPLLFDLRSDPLERKNLASQPRHAKLIGKLEAMTFAGDSWGKYQRQLRRDRKRMPQYASGKRPTTPNQYQLSDGRIFDAEASLYEQRFLAVPPHMTGGIIPQQVF